MVPKIPPLFIDKDEKKSQGSPQVSKAAYAGETLKRQESMKSFTGLPKTYGTLGTRGKKSVAMPTMPTNRNLMRKNVDTRIYSDVRLSTLPPLPGKILIYRVNKPFRYGTYKILFQIPFVLNSVCLKNCQTSEFHALSPLQKR